MRDYLTAASVFNLLCTPQLPRLVWNYGRRAARFGEHNGRYKHGRGSKRRRKRDYQVRDALLVCERLLAGELVQLGPRRLRRTYRELVLDPLPEASAVVSTTRAFARRLMDAVGKHGPASGWGVQQPTRVGRGAHLWTPYEIPKKSEKCWRWWRHACRELFRVLLHLDALLSSMIPLHATGKERTTAGERGSSTSPSPAEVRTRYRDHSAEGVAAILGRVLPATAM